MRTTPIRLILKAAGLRHAALIKRALDLAADSIPVDFHSPTGVTTRTIPMNEGVPNYLVRRTKHGIPIRAPFNAAPLAKIPTPPRGFLGRGIMTALRSIF